MNDNNYGSQALINALRASAQAFLDATDDAVGSTPGFANQAGAATAVQPAPGGSEPVAYDPLHDEPPFTPDPKASAPLEKRELASITYLGAIGRINAEEGRGATSAEVSEFAKKAGYAGGHAVNGWNSQAKSPRQIDNINGERFLNESGRGTVMHAAKLIGIVIVGELGLS